MDNYILTNQSNLLKWMYTSLLKEYSTTIHTFFPKSYWQKRGLNLLLNHPKIKFVRLPDKSEERQLKIISKKEVLVCLNPVTICNALEKENKEWLQFFSKHYFNKNTSLGYNPMKDEGFLEEQIKQKITVLNHSELSDVQASYVLPIRTLLVNLLKFPNKLEQVSKVYAKTQIAFFEAYEMFELLCYLKHYIAIANQQKVIFKKFYKLYRLFVALQSFTYNNFDKVQINLNLELLSQLNNHYQTLKDE